jgi:hypothetical protein
MPKRGSRIGSTGFPMEALAIARRWVEGCLRCGSIGGRANRIYYAMIGQTCVLLLCGGDKRKQASDVRSARDYFKDYLQRTRIQ